MFKSRCFAQLSVLAAAFAVGHQAAAMQPLFCRGIHNVEFSLGSSTLPPDFIAHEGHESQYAECLRCIGSADGEALVETYISDKEAALSGNGSSYLWLAAERSNAIRDELRKFGFRDTHVKSIAVSASRKSEMTRNARIEYHGGCNWTCQPSCSRLKEDIEPSSSGEPAMKEQLQEVSFSLRVHFPLDSSAVPAESVTDIASRVPCLNAISPVNVQLLSTGDNNPNGWDGKEQTNLAAQRLNSLRTLLVSRGVNGIAIAEIVATAHPEFGWFSDGHGDTVVSFVGQCRDESSCSQWCKDLSK